MQLQAGQVTEQVTIIAESPLLKTDRADVATTFEQRQVTDLPILDRNFTKLILLTPGTQQLGWQHAASENPQGSTQTMVNGQHFSGTGYQLDGTENRDPILGIIVINPNFESIGETKITSQNYDAEFGQAIAGVVSVSTRSGTNDLHGSGLSVPAERRVAGAQPILAIPKDPLTGKFVPDTLRNQFGGALGGPIVKDRFFLFGDYDGMRSKTGGSKIADRADGRGAQRRSVRVRREHLRPGDFGLRCQWRFDRAHTVRRQQDSDRVVCRRRRRTC